MEYQRHGIWTEFEHQTRSPYFLGAEMSVIDIYFAVMTNWRPGRKWFEDNAPKMLDVSARVARDPRLTEILKFHFA